MKQKSLSTYDSAISISSSGAKQSGVRDHIAWQLGVCISDLRLIPQVHRTALNFLAHMPYIEDFPLVEWEQAIAYLDGSNVHFLCYDDLRIYFQSMIE